MMKNTTDRRGAGLRFWIIAGGVALVLHAIIIWLVLPLFIKSQRVSRADAEQRTAEVEKRSAELEEARKRQREQIELKPETAEKMREIEEERRKPKLEENLKRLEEIEREIAEKADRALKELSAQTRKERRELRKEEVRRQVESLSAKVSKMLDGTQGHFVIGADASRRGSVVKKFDDIRIYHRLLDTGEMADFKDLPTGGLAHHWPVREGERNQIADLAGNRPADVPAVLAVRESKAEDAFSPYVLEFLHDARDSHLDTGPFSMETPVTVAMWVCPRRTKSQILAATSREGDPKGIQFSLMDVNEPDLRGMRLVLKSRGKSESGEVHSGDLVIQQDQWSHLAFSIDASTGLAEIFINGKNVSNVDEGEDALAGDLETGARGIDSELEDDFAKVEKVIEDLPTEFAPGAEDLRKVDEAVDALVEKFEEQKEAGMEKRGQDIAINNAERIKEAAEEYADRADEAGPDAAEIASKVEGENTDDSPTDTKDNSAAGLYDRALDMEKAIAEDFVKGRAAEIAATEDTDAEGAVQAAILITPARTDLAEKLAEAKSGNKVGAIDSHRRTLEEMEHTIEEMVSRAEAMRRQAPGSNKEEKSSAFANAARDGARSHNSGEMVDMSVITSAASAKGGTGSGASGSGSEGNLRTAGPGDGGEFALEPESISVGKGRSMKVLPSRRVTDEALRRSWLFIGTWFVIGPWDGGNSMDFSKTNPPETSIDLDGKYYDGKFADQPGHIDQVLSWRFYQSDRRRCEPPRVYGASIYYWFTEVYSDKDREVILAIGQDDGGRVWLNDVLIYEDDGRVGSADAIFEEIKGLRRVTLRKGFNRILVRHENGPAFCHQRIIIMPDDAVEVSASE